MSSTQILEATEGRDREENSTWVTTVSEDSFLLENSTYFNNTFNDTSYNDDWTHIPMHPCNAYINEINLSNHSGEKNSTYLNIITNIIYNIIYKK